MVRATHATARHARHKKLLAKTKGFRGGRRNLVTVARNADFKAGQHAYADRRRQRRSIRRLWITRINAAVRPSGIGYGRFMEGLKKAGVELDRRIIADMAVTAPDSFGTLVAVSKQALGLS